MIEIYPKYYKDFKCLMGECPNTCCKGWGIDIDKLTLKKYKNANGPYGAKLRQILKNNKQIFKIGNSCPFLEENGLCGIQKNLGEDYLCNVCKSFPRLKYTYGKYVEHNLSAACIEVSDFIVKNKFELEEKESSLKIESYNLFDSKLHPYILNCRTFIFKVIYSNISFDSKIQLLLDFSEELQDNFNVYSRIDEIISKYENKLNSYNDSVIEHFNLKRIVKLIKKYLSLERLTPYIYDKLYGLLHLIYNKRIKEEEFEMFVKNYRNINEFENILSYFIYRYFIRSVFDYKMESRIKLSIYSSLILILIGIFDSYKLGYFDTELNVKNLEMFSREVEHSEKNIKNLLKFFNKKTR